MCKQEEIAESLKTPAVKRSKFLFFLGVPMMFIAALGTKHILFTILAVIYVVALFINGIIVLPIVLKIFRNKT